MLAGFARRLAGVRFEPTVVNGQPGALLRHPNGDLISVLSLDIADGQVCGVRSIINPEKLQHLRTIVGPLADLEQIRSDVLGKRP
jgi:RNA polymerase sigma-70 factor (ECF subfamily)